MSLSHVSINKRGKFQQNRGTSKRPLGQPRKNAGQNNKKNSRLFIFPIKAHKSKFDLNQSTLSFLSALAHQTPNQSILANHVRVSEKIRNNQTIHSVPFSLSPKSQKPYILVTRQFFHHIAPRTFLPFLRLLSSTKLHKPRSAEFGSRKTMAPSLLTLSPLPPP